MFVTSVTVVGFYSKVLDGRVDKSSTLLCTVQLGLQSGRGQILGIKAVTAVWYCTSVETRGTGGG